MNRKMFLLKGFTFLCFCVLSANVIWAQDYCEGNFDYDLDVDGGDAALFKADFGRSQFKNPCPTDGPAPVPKTGQVRCYTWEGERRDCTSGEDGELQKGVEWPDPRFTDNGDGTVTDNLTGLMWLQNVTCMKTHYATFDNDGTSDDGLVTWQHALDFVAGINAGTYSLCSADHSDWRLPNVRELFSLLDFYSYPWISLNSIFSNVFEALGSSWWTSTTFVFTPSHTYCVDIQYGFVTTLHQESHFGHVWPVRGGR